MRGYDYSRICLGGGWAHIADVPYLCTCHGEVHV